MQQSLRRFFFEQLFKEPPKFAIQTIGFTWAYFSRNLSEVFTKKAKKIFSTAIETTMVDKHFCNNRIVFQRIIHKISLK